MDIPLDRLGPPDVLAGLVAGRRAGHRARARRQHLAGAAANLLAQRGAGDATQHHAESLIALTHVPEFDVAAARDRAVLHLRGGQCLAGAVDPGVLLRRTGGQADRSDGGRKRGCRDCSKHLSLIPFLAAGPRRSRGFVVVPE